MEILNRIWVLVAHESGARIFSRKNRKSPLELVESIDHPIGRAKNREILRDRQGSDQSWGPSKQRHGVGDTVDPVEKNALDFARFLTEKIDKARDLDRFDHLVLVAGPKFLGMIRTELSPRTARLIIASIGQNLGGFTDRDIPGHIGLALKTHDEVAGLRKPA